LSQKLEVSFKNVFLTDSVVFLVYLCDICAVIKTIIFSIEIGGIENFCKDSERSKSEL
jgi:hypothetical protein